MKSGIQQELTLKYPYPRAHHYSLFLGDDVTKEMEEKATITQPKDVILRNILHSQVKR